MKKIKTSHDMMIPGWGMIKEGTPLSVERFNKRFVYVKIYSGVMLRLTRKADFLVLY